MPTTKIKKLRRRAKLKAFAERFGIIFSGMVFVLAGITYLARLDELTISSVEVEGNRVIQSREVVANVAEVISGRYVFLPKRNILIYPKDGVENSLKRNFSHLKSVDIEREGLNTVLVTVVERKPDALWCGFDPLNDNDNCFYVDEEGFVYAEAPYFSGDVFFRYYGGDVRRARPIRSIVAPIDELLRLKIFLSYLSEIGFTSRSVLFMEKEIHIYLNKKSALYIDRNDSFENVFSRLYSLIRGSEFQFLTDDGFAFEYIDLRFGRSVFYKPLEEIGDE